MITTRAVVAGVERRRREGERGREEDSSIERDRHTEKGSHPANRSRTLTF